MEIRPLSSLDAEQCQELRLKALRECPTAFASSYEEECETPLDVVAQRLVPDDDRIVFGTFDGERLVGTVALQRESKRKLAHKAVVWGVYVDARYRNRGIGRKLMKRLIAHAAGMRALRRLTLGVNAANRAAAALYESVGFEPFGVQRGFLLVDGVLQDEVHMAYVFSDPGR